MVNGAGHEYKLVVVFLLFLLAVGVVPAGYSSTTNTVEYASLTLVNATSLTAQWKVPAQPATTSGNQGIMLYIELGTSPSTDQLLGVLQYGWFPATGGGQYWMIYSDHTGYGQEISHGTEQQVSSGDTLVASIVQNSGTHYWTATIKDTTTGDSSVIILSSALTMRLAYPAVLQVQSVQTCSDYPSTHPATFDSIQVFNSSSLVSSPAWEKSIPVNDGCGENVIVNSESSVALDWNPGVVTTTTTSTTSTTSYTTSTTSTATGTASTTSTSTAASTSTTTTTSTSSTTTTSVTSITNVTSTASTTTSSTQAATSSSTTSTTSQATGTTGSSTGATSTSSTSATAAPSDDTAALLYGGSGLAIGVVAIVAYLYLRRKQKQ